MSRQATAHPGARKPILPAAVVLLLAMPASAQLRQYSPPGQLAERDIPPRETLRERIADAPWEAGRWRLQPRLSIGDIVYSNNVFDDSEESRQESDLRARASAGLDAYAPIGSDVVFAVFAGPSYQWWQDNEDLRRLNWNYGAALFGLYNHLSTGLSVRRSERERPLNNELRIPTTIRRDSVALDARVSVRGPWQVFGSASFNETRYPSASDLEDRVPDLDLLARDEDVLSLGVAYDIPNRLNVGVGWRRVDAEFVTDPQFRSNSSEYPFLSFVIPGNKVQLGGDVGLRLLEFESASALSETEEAVGTLRASFEIGSRTSLTVFGGRDIVYSAVDAGGFFASDRQGLALGWGESGALRATVFAQAGSDEFESAAGMNTGRIDDDTSYGVDLQIPLRWGLAMRLGVTETEIDSNFDDFDRSLTSIHSWVSLDLPDFPF